MASSFSLLLFFFLKHHTQSQLPFPLCVFLRHRYSPLQRAQMNSCHVNTGRFSHTHTHIHALTLPLRFSLCGLSSCISISLTASEERRTKHKNPHSRRTLPHKHAHTNANMKIHKRPCVLNKNPFGLSVAEAQEAA